MQPVNMRALQMSPSPPLLGVYQLAWACCEAYQWCPRSCGYECGSPVDILTKTTQSMPTVFEYEAELFAFHFWTSDPTQRISLLLIHARFDVIVSVAN
jgi:hypothetical protein